MPWNGSPEQDVLTATARGKVTPEPPVSNWNGWGVEALSVLIIGGPIVSGLVIFTTWAIHKIVT